MRPAQIFMNTGHQVIGRPSLGSWLSYGLGSESRDLPAFVVLLSGENHPDGGKSCWGSGFLPTSHQGVEFRRAASRCCSRPTRTASTPEVRGRSIGGDQRLNRLHAARCPGSRDPDAHRRVRDGVPDADERPGPDRPRRRSRRRFTSCTARSRDKASFANNCLLARRLVERGVRFVQLYHRGWDTHGASFGEDIVEKLPHSAARRTGRSTACSRT